LNAEDVLIERPINAEAGNDAHRQVLYEGLRALVESREEFVRPIGSTAAERIVITEIRLQPFDDHGEPIDVQAEDFVTYPDYRGVVQRLRITAVEPLTVLGKLDQLILTADLS
jgi:hypothetical protein